MRTPEQISIACAAVADQLEAIMRDHEEEGHGGRTCFGNRASTIAFLAHRLAVRNEYWDHASTLLEEYDRRCTKATCGHHRQDEAEPKEGEFISAAPAHGYTVVTLQDGGGFCLAIQFDLQIGRRTLAVSLPLENALALASMIVSHVSMIKAQFPGGFKR